MSPGIAIIGLWLLWLVSWLIAALWSRPAEKHVDIARMLRYRIPMLLGTLLLIPQAHGYEGALRLWHVGWNGAWLCVVLVAAGIAFAWWARIHLGVLWSGAVTRKTDHRIVDSGPYAIVRHPIYTGLLLSLLATSVAKGTLLAATGFALLAFGIVLKARLEERWLSAELDPGAYAAYRQRVPMLIPFGPRDDRQG
ncbi:MAG: isoprenylcysteine carboxylmethyltransferase family protein [Proteobacteria bacterium]|nr:isoprenylcysteine carboxylmethyltransferase family protein [Pseudomonadota bacterium]